MSCELLNRHWLSRMYAHAQQEARVATLPFGFLTDWATPLTEIINARFEIGAEGRVMQLQRSEGHTHGESGPQNFRASI